MIDPTELENLGEYDLAEDERREAQERYRLKEIHDREDREEYERKRKAAQKRRRNR